MQIYIDADHKKEQDLLRLRLYCTPAGTPLLCQHILATYYRYFLLKSPGLSVVSDPRNGLRHKQERVTMKKVGFYNSLNVP